MKKITVAFLTLILVLSLAACGGEIVPSGSEAVSPSGENQPMEFSSQVPESEPSVPDDPSQSESGANDLTAAPKSKEKQIKITINEEEYAATLYDTAAANSLYELLPMTVTFEDYNGVEKIAYLPEGQSLATDGEPSGFDPAVGDLCLYAPWGNLSVFYQDFRYSDGLISLGRIPDTAVEAAAGMDGAFSVTIEKSE